MGAGEARCGSLEASPRRSSSASPDVARAAAGQKGRGDDVRLSNSCRSRPMLQKREQGLQSVSTEKQTNPPHPPLSSLQTGLSPPSDRAACARTPGGGGGGYDDPLLSHLTTAELTLKPCRLQVRHEVVENYPCARFHPCPLRFCHLHLQRLGRPTYPSTGCQIHFEVLEPRSS